MTNKGKYSYDYSYSLITTTDKENVVPISPRIVSVYIGLDFYKHAKNQLQNILFLTIMQWYGILVILSTLDIPGHAHQKW